MGLELGLLFEEKNGGGGASLGMLTHTTQVECLQWDCPLNRMCFEHQFMTLRQRTGELTRRGTATAAEPE
jgi:hypothetical protein